MITPSNEEYTIKNFIHTYMNDHNRGTPRWLRSIFFNEKEKIEKILEYMQGIEDKFSSHRTAEKRALIEEICEKLLNEIHEESHGTTTIWVRRVDVYNMLKIFSHLESDNK